MRYAVLLYVDSGLAAGPRAPEWDTLDEAAKLWEAEHGTIEIRPILRGPAE
jgi:hypothetical protein